MTNRELRFLSTEIRAQGGRLSGYAARYNSDSRQIPGVGIERILPGAFDRSLLAAEDGEQDITMNCSHNEMFTLGSVVMGNLHLASDAMGLKFDVTPPNTEYARAAVEAVREGRMNGCSFAFSPISESRTPAGVRVLKDMILQHLTICHGELAAYPAANVEAREYRSVGCYYELRSVMYLVTESDGTQHLPVTGEDGKPDHHLMGAAWAALMNPNGFRGRKYEGPNKQKAIEKLKSIYKSEGMPLPDSGRMLDYNDPLDRTIMDGDLHRDFLRLGGESRIYIDPSQVPGYVPKDARKQWMEIWNSAFQKARKDGLSDKDAEAKAFAEANGVIKKEMAH